MNRSILFGIALLLVAGLGLLIPRALDAVNASALRSFNAGNPVDAAKTFGLLARFGHADATNNLAVIRYRGLDGIRDQDEAESLWESAHGKGHGVAGYNLALLTPNRHNTPMADVAVTLNRLDPLVQAGDPHAAALMARHLYYNNRDALVENLEERRLSLLAQAAASGDPVYTYIHARALWDAAQPDDADGMRQAVEVMHIAAKAGEPRAMLHMGDMYRQSRRSFKDSFEGGFPGGDNFDWWDRGSTAGEIASTCRYGVNWFREVSRRDTPLPQHRGALETPDAQTAKALTHVKACANAGKRARRPNPAFGDPALYLWRPLGGFETSTNAIAASQMVYGLLRLEGRLLPRDVEEGRVYLTRAAEENTRARAALRALDIGRPE